MTFINVKNLYADGTDSLNSCLLQRKALNLESNHIIWKFLSDTKTKLKRCRLTVDLPECLGLEPACLRHKGRETVHCSLGLPRTAYDIITAARIHNLSTKMSQKSEAGKNSTRAIGFHIRPQGFRVRSCRLDHCYYGSIFFKFRCYALCLLSICFIFWWIAPMKVILFLWSL